MAEMPHLRAVLALGKIAHDSTVVALGSRPSKMPFAHGSARPLGAQMLFDSYHCSRLNTNTGVLTPAMFSAVIAKIRECLDDPLSAETTRA